MTIYEIDSLVMRFLDHKMQFGKVFWYRLLYALGILFLLAAILIGILVYRMYTEDTWIPLTLLSRKIDWI